MYAPHSEKKQFERPPAGWTLMVCSRLIDKGTHWVPPKDNKPGKYVRKLSIGYELQHLMTEGEFAGQPFVVYANFNYSMFKNSFLCKHIESWRGKAFEDQEEANKFNLAKLIGQPAYGNIIRNGDFDNIQPIGPVPDGMTAPEIKGKTILIDQANLDPKEVEKLSEKMRERVMSAEERKEGTQMGKPSSQNQGTEIQSENPGEGLSYADAGFDDDIPFTKVFDKF